MKHYLLLIAVALLASCVTTDEDADVDAIKDFIEVNNLEEVSVIRSFDQVGSKVINQRYIVVTTRKDRYLLVYAHPCPDYDDVKRRADIRRDPRAIFAGSDTFRGCRIKALYPISEDQAMELEEIGKAPGQ